MGKDFAYYFNKSGPTNAKVSVAGPMRGYLNNVFKNKAALKELWNSSDFLKNRYQNIYNETISRNEFLNKAKNGELGSLLESLIKE